MPTFDRKKFFDAYRSEWGRLDNQQVRGLERLLTRIEADRFVTGIPTAAYILATVKHETADTFTPIHEYGSKSYFVRRYGGQTRKGKELGNDTPDEGYYYAGKGDTQVTGEANYEKAEKAIRKDYPEIVADFENRTGKQFDLTVGDQENDTEDPRNMLDPAISYAVMSYGMRTGMFTGRKLSTYISNGHKDYINARKVINGTDKDDLIAAYAEHFEDFLTLASIESAFKGVTEKEIDNAITFDNDIDSAAAKTADLPTASPSKEPETGSESATTQQQPIQAVEVPQVAASTEPPKEDTLTKIGNKVNAVYTAVGGAAAGIIAWFSSSSGLIVGAVVGGITIAGIAYMIINWRRNENLERRNAEAAEKDKARAHEIQMLSLKSHADPNLQSVVIAPPPPTEITQEAK